VVHVLLRTTTTNCINCINYIFCVNCILIVLLLVIVLTVLFPGEGASPLPRSHPRFILQCNVELFHCTTILHASLPLHYSQLHPNRFRAPSLSLTLLRAIKQITDAATSSSSSAESAISAILLSNKMLSCVTRMLANNCLPTNVVLKIDVFNYRTVI